MRLWIVLLTIDCGNVSAFRVGVHSKSTRRLQQQQQRKLPFDFDRPSSLSKNMLVTLKTKNSEDEEAESGSSEFLMERVDESDLSEDVWQDLEAGQPSEWMVMKELLGINVFTYILAGTILFFLSMNFILGPGWLGSVIGIQGTGEFTQTSESLPETIDLGNKNFLL